MVAGFILEAVFNIGFSPILPVDQKRMLIGAVNLQRLTVVPKASNKTGWVIFFMWLRFKQVIYGEDLIFGKITGFASDI